MVKAAKFICSGVDTAHVEERKRQFLAAGINAATYTYKDLEEDRAETTNEFRGADSSIRGLITVTAASRGFDVPDVSCVIMARPAAQELGRAYPAIWPGGSASARRLAKRLYCFGSLWQLCAIL